MLYFSQLIQYYNLIKKIISNLFSYLSQKMLLWYTSNYISFYINKTYYPLFYNYIFFIYIYTSKNIYIQLVIFYIIKDNKKILLLLLFMLSMNITIHTKIIFNPVLLNIHINIIYIYMYSEKQNFFTSIQSSIFYTYMIIYI